jgi:spore coat polysaccharide biosynthesis predicted glycosyltransferase SpsG
MRVGFRVDSSPIIGLGHIYRSITLAKEFKNLGVKVFFYTSNFDGNSDEIIKKNGFNLIKLNKNKIKKNKINFLKKDADKTIKYIIRNKINLLIIDNYLIDEIWERKVSRFCKIALIEDCLKRKTFCDFIISYHLSSKGISNFLLKKKNCLILEDSQYTIIKKNLIKKKSIKNKNVLVYLGGADRFNYLNILVKKFNTKQYKNINFTFITNKKKIRNFENHLFFNKNLKFITKHQKDLYFLANKNKLVISNMGLSMYEFAHMGLNLILLPQSNIHKKIANNLKKFKIFKIFNSPKDLTFNNIKEGLAESKKIVKERTTLFNGFGAKNLACFFLKKFPSLKLKRLEDEDKYFLYKLVNDNAVRRSSIKSKKITFKNHLNWFYRLRKKKQNKLFILKSKNLKIGQIRLEKEKDYYKLDYSISNEFRNMGFGYKMIVLAIRKYNLKKIQAIIKRNNIASIKTLKKAKFKKISQSNREFHFQFLNK